MASITEHSIDISATARRFASVERRGLTLLHIFDDNVARGAINMAAVPDAQKVADSTIIGTPTIVSNACRFENKLNYFQTAAVDSPDMTIYYVGRAVTPGDNLYHWGNFGPPAGGGANAAGTAFRLDGAGGTTERHNTAFGPDDPAARDDKQRAVDVAYTSGFKLTVCRVTSSGATAGIEVMNATAGTPWVQTLEDGGRARLPTVDNLALGSCSKVTLGLDGGQTDAAWFQFHDVAHTDGEVANTINQIRAYELGRFGRVI